MRILCVRQNAVDRSRRCGARAALALIASFLAVAYFVAPVTSSTVPPLAASISTPAGVQFDRIALHYTLHAEEAGEVDVKVEYSIDGPAGPFAPATEALGSPSEGTRTLAATTAGTKHVFVWNAWYDLDPQRITHSERVVVRLHAWSSLGLTVVATRPFEIDNRLFTFAAGTDASPSRVFEPPDSAATDVKFYGMTQMARDRRRGSLYVADDKTPRVIAFELGGLAKTVAGTGVPASDAVGFGGAALEASFNQIMGTAIDDNGLVFFTITFGYRGVAYVNPKTGVVREATSRGRRADGATYTFLGPRQIYSLPSEAGRRDVLFIVDSGGHRISRLNYTADRASGLINPGASVDALVGQIGLGGFSPDGTPAAKARITLPGGVVYHPGLRMLLFTDNQAVRGVELPDPRGTPGAVRTLAGVWGESGFTGDGGPAKSARFRNPRGLAVDRAGAIYVWDTGNNRVRRFVPDGPIQTIAGDGGAEDHGLGGSALAADVAEPESVIVADNSEVYVSSTGLRQVLRIDIAGRLTPVAGRPPRPVIGDGLPATEIPILAPAVVFDDEMQTMWAADNGNNVIWRIDLATGVAKRVAGTGIKSSTGSNGPAIDASLNEPVWLTRDGAGNLYVSERFGSKVRKIRPDGIIVDFAGTGIRGDSGDGGPAARARLAEPRGIHFSRKTGRLYIADHAARKVRMVSLDGSITTICGTGQLEGGNASDGTAATEATIGAAVAVWTDADETVYLSITSQQRVIKFPVGGTISTVAGILNRKGYNGDSIPANRAELAAPFGVWGDSSGNIFIADMDNARVRKVDAATGLISTVAGYGRFSLNAAQRLDVLLSGPSGIDPKRAGMTHPQGLMLDARDNIWVRDTGGFAAYRFRPRELAMPPGTPMKPTPRQ